MACPDARGAPQVEELLDRLGFQLLHVLPHELGHHRDRMTTRSRISAARGEPFAERYANEVFERLWPDCDPG